MATMKFFWLHTVWLQPLLALWYQKTFHGEPPNTLSSVKNVKTQRHKVLSWKAQFVSDPEVLTTHANLTAMSKKLYKQCSYFGM